MCQAGPDFFPNEMTFDKPNALFLNTGKMQRNPDLDEVAKTPDLKLNDYVVYDESQIKMRYLIDFQIVIN